MSPSENTPNRTNLTAATWREAGPAADLMTATLAGLTLSERSRLVADARDWLADCAWADEPDLSRLSAESILYGIERHYDGGLGAFLDDGDAFRVLLGSPY